MPSRPVRRPSSLSALLLVEPDFFSQSDPQQLRTTPETDAERAVLDVLSKLGHRASVVPFRSHRRGRSIAEVILRSSPDVVFNFVEQMADDRRLAANVPAFLSVLGIPYTGSDAVGMAATIDKAASKHAVRSIGIPVPAFVVFPVGAIRAPRLPFDFPAIVKSQFGGGSIGLTLKSVVTSERELLGRVRNIHQGLNEPAICEQYIEGREVSVGMIEDKGGVLVLPIRETVFGRAGSGGPRFYTERVKDNASYRRRWDIHHQQAELPPALQHRIRTLCKAAFRVLGMSGYGRIDIRIDAAGTPMFLEANSNPDLSPRNFGLMGSWIGLTYEDIVVKVLRAALGRRSVL